MTETAAASGPIRKTNNYVSITRKAKNYAVFKKKSIERKAHVDRICRDYQRSSASESPGPRGLPVLGVLPKFMRDPLRCLMEAVPYGPIVSLGANTYSINDPALVKYFL